MTELERCKTELEKCKYHISLIKETIDSESHPIPSLVIEMDWTEDDLDAAHGIFERYRVRQNEGSVSSYGLERALRNKFDIGANTAKSIILAFFRARKCVDVCTEYAKANPCAEFDEILKRQQVQ